jgi:predicted nucleic acid-binding Zn ribbon protein
VGTAGTADAAVGAAGLEAGEAVDASMAGGRDTPTEARICSTDCAGGFAGDTNAAVIRASFARRSSARRAFFFASSSCDELIIQEKDKKKKRNKNLLSVTLKVLSLALAFLIHNKT